MAKIFECIYAYLYRNNYLGECGQADGVYTVTEGLEYADEDMLHMVVSQKIPRLNLANVDEEEGVCLNARDEIRTDYKTESFSYYPDIAGAGVVAFCRSGLRESLKDKAIRGSKEITHALLIEGMPSDFYAVDLMESSVFFAHKDIPLTDTQKVGGEDYVTEEVPSRLKPLAMENFRARSLRAQDIFNEDDDALKVIAEILHAVITAKKQKKTAYFVYNTEDAQTAKKYIYFALKLLPARLANKISFVTYCGDTGFTAADICGVPTSDGEYISELKRGAFVVELRMQRAYTNATEQKGAFTEFLHKASEYDLEKWLRESMAYAAYIRSFEDLDYLTLLYLNRTNKEESPDVERALARVADSLEMLGKNFELVAKINKELFYQLESLAKPIQVVKGGAYTLSSEILMRKVILPLVRLYNDCKAQGAEEETAVLEYLYSLLFSVDTGNEQALQKRYELLSGYREYIKKELGANFKAFVSYMEKTWRDTQRFFDGYFAENKYREQATTVCIDFLHILLANVERERDNYAYIRDYFVNAYLETNSDSIGKLFIILFGESRLSYEGQFRYVFERFFRVSGIDATLQRDWLEAFCVFVAENNLLESAVAYYRSIYTLQPESTEVIEPVLSRLLQFYIQAPKQNTIEGLYESFAVVKKLLGENAGAGLQKFLYADFFKRIVAPVYEDIFEKARFETFTEETLRQCTQLREEFSKPYLAAVGGKAFADTITKKLDAYEVFCTQSRRETDLEEFRIEFVLREFLSFDFKTIFRMLADVVGEEALLARMQTANIPLRGYKKNPNFYEFARSVASEYLEDRQIDKSAEEQAKALKEKVDFCTKVRDIKNKKNKQYRLNRRTDVDNALISSTVFSVLAALLAGVIGRIICGVVGGGYFIGIYIIFALVMFPIAELSYWSNFKDRRLRNNMVQAAWQTVAAFIVLIGLFVGVQALLVAIGV